jgi:N-carbamoylputrescine amidase
MRVTVCELPHEPAALASAWAGLCRHAYRHRSELVLLPEFAFVDPVWESRVFDQERWAAALTASAAWLDRLAELRVDLVVGARPATIDGRPFNEGFLWSRHHGVRPLRRKWYLPDDPGSWEARWFDRGDPDFPAFRAGSVSFGLNICSELWALETCASYASEGVQLILSPRATAAATTARWLSLGVVAAVRSGAFSVSSNRVDSTGACGGFGWIIAPDGQVLATTTPEVPFATIELDLAAPAAARLGYPCSLFHAPSISGPLPDPALD